MDDSNLMLDYLKIFELHNVEILYYDTYNDSDNISTKIKLGLSTKVKYVSKEQLISFLILSSFFDTWLVRDIDIVYDEIKSEIYRKGSDEHANEKALINSVLSQYFHNYIKEYEVEIYCELEREKSSFYIYKYKAERDNLKYIHHNNYVVSKI
ncbi:hypothetical protein [Sulfurimonas sp.]|uniref:hypothetical protein n=1 Tax=Sulfurimonas sp. TaxID=2022749 RepID=UPI002AB1BC86|nr:hypothetical protein [Sulfurimonas sp.]